MRRITLSLLCFGLLAIGTCYLPWVDYGPKLEVRYCFLTVCFQK